MGIHAANDPSESDCWGCYTVALLCPSLVPDTQSLTGCQYPGISMLLTPSRFIDRAFPSLATLLQQMTW